MSKNYGNDSQIAEIVKYISDTMKLPLIGAGGGFAPIGMYGFSCDYVLTPPQGWLFADGSIYNIADYPEYAALLASQHGRANIYGGDGITTFATKDLRGEFLRGWGQNSHENQGNGGAVGEHQDGTQHSNVYVWDSTIGVSTYGSSGNRASCREFDNTVTARDSSCYVVGTDASQQSNTASIFTSRPTNTSVAFLVKVTLSDAEINAFNVYTPREHQVGWWEEEIDGVWKRKPVYERTITGLSITLSDSGYVTAFSKSQYGVDKTISAVGFTIDKTFPLCIKIDSGNIQLFMSGMGDYVVNTLTLRYTKTTDDWQTS